LFRDRVSLTYPMEWTTWPGIEKTTTIVVFKTDKNHSINR
jgi:hypothetical protein